MRIWIPMMLVAACDPRGLMEDESNEEIRARVRRDRDERDKEPPPPAQKKPLEIEWSKDSIGNSKGSIKGGGTIEVSGYKGRYHITLRDVPKWSKWKTGTQSGRAKSDSSYELIDVEILDKVGNLTWKELEAVDPTAELELELQDGRTGKTKLPPIGLAYTVDDMLKTVENAPVLFGKEPDDPKKQDSLYWPGGLYDKKVYGKAGKLYEIDWVVATRKLPETKGTKTCGGYQSKGQPMPDITLELKEVEAVIYDRRTGDVVDKKVFAPDSECPMFTYQKAGDRKTDSMTPYSAIDGWLRTKVKR